jgi:hypothetical protein
MINSIEQIENGTVIDKMIEIKSIYKNGKTTVQPVRDPLSNWYKGVERLSDEDKRHRKFWAESNTSFTLKDGVIFDLNREDHKITWDWIKHQPCLAMSYEECQSRPSAEFYVHMRNKEALKRISIKKLKAKASGLILNDPASNYPLRAKLLGVNMDGEKEVDVILDFLLDQAEASPIKVIKIYEDKLVSLRMLLISAVEKGKVIIDPSGAYRYGNLYLGMAEDTAIDWLNSSDNKATARLLEQEVNPEYFASKAEPVILDPAAEAGITTEPVAPVEAPVEASAPTVAPVAKKVVAKKAVTKKRK